MRPFIALVLFASFASAQTPETDAAIKAKLATLKFVASLYDAETGGYAAEPKGKPSLRAANAAVKATKYLGGKLDDKEKTSKFVLGCYDEKTGAFAEPGGKPDVTTTCIGVMAAMELGIAKEKIGKAPEYIMEKAKTFEDVRIGAAAVEAWGGVKEWPTTIPDWEDLTRTEMVRDKSARTFASVWVTHSRLGMRTGERMMVAVEHSIHQDQFAHGGWGQSASKDADLETTYRVLRACRMLRFEPKGLHATRKWAAKHRNDDGGYATKPGEKSSAAGTYYAVIVLKWLDELEKK